MNISDNPCKEDYKTYLQDGNFYSHDRVFDMDISLDNMEHTYNSSFIHLLLLIKI